MVASAALQNLDLDIFFDQWQPPPGLFDKSLLRGLPQHGIGRTCKVGKEQVVGLLIALRLFTGGSYEQQNIRNLKLLENLYRKLNPKFQSLAEIVMTPGSEEPVLLSLIHI